MECQGEQKEEEPVSKTLTQSQLDKVAGYPSREAATILGVGKSTVNKYREIARLNGGHLPLGDSVNHKVLHLNDAVDGSTSALEARSDGSLSVETSGDVPQNKDQVDEAMRKRGFDPEDYTFNYRFSEWQANVGGGELITMYAARASAVPKREKANAEALDVSELLEVVRSWEFTPVIRGGYSSVDQVVAFADPQIGKTDANGGTDETTEQVMNSFAAAAERAKEVKPRAILFADLGDGLENFNNTPAQRESNDLDLTSQVRLLRRLQAEGIRMLAPLCETLIHASSPSNHGQVRVGPQQMASTPSNDWGIEVSHQLEDVFAESKLDNLRFIRPDGDHSISVRVELPSGTVIGMSHGDQAAENALALWWMKQAFGWDNPLRDAHLFLHGHYHNQAIEEVFKGRWRIGCASSDRGSAWFENKTGRSATSGMTTFLTADGGWGDLELV